MMHGTCWQYKLSYHFAPDSKPYTSLRVRLFRYLTHYVITDKSYERSDERSAVNSFVLI